MTTPRNAATTAQSLAHLDTQVSNVATTLEGFIKETAEFRVRTEKEQTQIWAAIREQGDNLRNAVEKLSTRGQLSWGMIISTGGFLLLVISAVASLNNALMEGKLEQVKIAVSKDKEIMEAKLGTAESERKAILRICDENHEILDRMRSK